MRPKNMIRAAAAMLAVVMAFAGVASATPNFVDNNTALPGQKTDRTPCTNQALQWCAADANAVFGALTDIRTVLQRSPVNVKAFGATGTGLVDDSGAINLAIAAAAATVNGAYGGVVYFPKGTYRLSSQIVVPNGVKLKGEGAASTFLIARGNSSCPGSTCAFSGTSLVTNQVKNGTQEYGYLEDLFIDGNAGDGATETEAVVSWGSLFVNSFIKNVTIMHGSGNGLHIFASGTPGGTGPMTIDNLWVANNGAHNLYVEDAVTNTGAIAGLIFTNLISENQGSNSSAVYLKGTGHFGQCSFVNTHIEQGGSQTGRTAITIDGASHVLFNGVQLQAGTPANIVAGITITNVAANVGIQIRGVSNINVINPVLNDVKNSVTVAGANLPKYDTPEVVSIGLPVAPANGKSLIVQDSTATNRAWFDTNGRLTGNGPFGAALEMLGNPQGTPGSSDDRVWMVMDHTGSNPFGFYFPNGGGGAVRERMYTAGQDVRQVATNGSVFNYTAHTFQSAVTFQSQISGTTVSSTGAGPTISSCGTGPGIAAGSTNFAGTFTTGSGATTCTLTFATGAAAFTNAPTCMVEASGQVIPTLGTVTASTLPITVDVASTTYRYICVGH